jgi:hypothetical protein
VSSNMASGGKMAGFPKSSCATSETCDSRRCVLTGSFDGGRGGYKVCCAWDIYMTMAAGTGDEVGGSGGSDGDGEGGKAVASIPTVFVTMQDSDAIYSTYPALATEVGRGGGAVGQDAALYTRYRPWVNWSSILIWALGVATTAYASWAAGEDLRRKHNAKRAAATNSAMANAKSNVGHGVGKDPMDGGGSGVGVPGAIDQLFFGGFDRTGSPSSVYTHDGCKVNHSGAHGSPHGGRGSNRGGDDDDADDDDALELTLPHAFGFIVVASTVLLVLFYVDLYLFVTLLFCVSAVSSVATVLAKPFLRGILGPRHSTRTLCYLPYGGGGVSNVDGIAYVLSAVAAVFWFIVRSSWPWAFVLQDIFGMCLCVVFLSVIRLSNIKVATILLSMAFLYDIFFVFISPYFFQESIMEKVATGNLPTADPDICEKYPSAAGCESSELPMLLLLPRLGDYTGGYTMLGLGDIVLPGLLVAFAARYDAARRASPATNWLLMVAGYALGLALANIAVYAMDMGQPALLYLVPCTLGALITQARRDDKLDELWAGPPELAVSYLRMPAAEVTHLSNAVGSPLLSCSSSRSSPLPPPPLPPPSSSPGSSVGSSSLPTTAALPVIGGAGAAVVQAACARRGGTYDAIEAEEEEDTYLLGAASLVDV